MKRARLEIELPKSCLECPLLHRPNEYMSQWWCPGGIHGYKVRGDGRSLFCSLVIIDDDVSQIPAPETLASNLVSQIKRGTMKYMILDG